MSDKVLETVAVISFAICGLHIPFIDFSRPVADYPLFLAGGIVGWLCIIICYICRLWETK